MFKTFILALILLFQLSSIADPNIKKIDSKALFEAQRSRQAEVIVYLNSRATLSKAESFQNRTSRVSYVYTQLRSLALESQKNLIQFLDSASADYKSFYIVNAVLVYDASPELIKKIAAMPEVSRVAFNVSSRLNLVVPPQPTRKFADDGTPSHLKFIQAQRVWHELGHRGKGITLAGQDTGFYWQHNSLSRQYRGYNNGASDHNYNWHDAIDRTLTPIDDTGHGTHTMGTMVGDDLKKNHIGVAPEANWIGCRNMKKGVGSVATYLECFEFFLAPYPLNGDPKTDGRPELAPHIVNNSWGCPIEEGCKGDEFVEAIRALKAAGIMVVVASGNQGPNCGSVNMAPATYSGDVLSVGAYNRYTRDIAFFSSIGPSTDGGLAPLVVAPGESIRSSVIGGPDKYEDKPGTSMASPQVAGVIALLWSAYPLLIGQIDLTIDIVTKSARPLKSTMNCKAFPGQQIPNAVFGYGIIDAYNAISLASNFVMTSAKLPNLLKVKK